MFPSGVRWIILQATLTIQKMRYQDKMEFEIDVDEGIMNQQIIKLVLQPVVENAIYLGIKYKEEGR